MSVGNLKDSGNQGNNFPYQLTSLKLLSAINAGVALGATEATLQLVLAAIQDGQDYEAKLVEDATGATFLEVRIWNPDTQSWEPPKYYKPGDNTPYNIGDPGGPVAPIVYINPSSYLAQIVTNTTGLNLEVTQLLVKGVLDAIKLDTANLDVALSTRATEATQLLVKAVLDTIKADTALINSNVVLGNLTLNTIDTVLDNIKLDTANLDVLLSTRASEATLVTVNNSLGFIFGQLQTVDTTLNTVVAKEATLITVDQKLGLLTVAKTPTSVASAGVTNIPAGATEISVFNNGTGDATVNGVKCPPGVTRTFGFKNPTSAIIVCDGLGTEELIIDYMV